MASDISFAGNIQEKVIPPPHNNPPTTSSNCEELFHSEFKPSLDEKIILKGRSFLVKGFFDVLDGYAYLTSKRYSFCDTAGASIVFQISSKGIVSIEEGRQLFSKKIIITTISGEVIQIKCSPHAEWLRAFLEPNVFATGTEKSKDNLTHGNTSSLDWYYEANGINIGPVKENIVVQLIQNNHTIFRDTKVWNSSMLEWKPAEDTILTIYFSEPTISSEDPARAMLTSRLSGPSFFPRIKLLFRKYF